MRVSAETPAALPSGHQGGNANAGHAHGGNKADSGFDHALRHAGKSAQTHRAASADAPSERQGWMPFAENFTEKALDTDAGDKVDGEEASSDADEAPEQDKPRHAQAEPPPGRTPLPWSPALHDPFRQHAKAEAAAARTPGKAAADTTVADAGDHVAMPAVKQNETLPAMGGSAETVTQPDELADALKAAARKSQEPTTPQDNSAAAPDRSGQQSAKPVTVTAAQSFVAPAPYPTSPTITALAGAIATDGDAKQVLAASAGLNGTATPVAVASHMLKIELHPAELGVVTANLRLAGGQLSIELRPESQEAHRRLSSDSDTLMKSLQGLGFTVDKITVLQPSVAINAAPRPDAANAAANPAGRDPSSFQSGNSGGDGAPSGGQQFGRNRGDDGQHASQTGSHARERGGGGLFI